MIKISDKKLFFANNHYRFKAEGIYAVIFLNIVFVAMFLSAVQKISAASLPSSDTDESERIRVCLKIVEGRSSDSRKFAAFLELGDINTKSGRTQEASNYYLSAYYHARRRHEKIAALMRLSDVSYSHGSLGKAIEFAKDAINLSPRDVFLRKKLAAYYVSAELWKQAAQEYKKIINLQGDDQETLFRLAEVFEHLGLYGEAIDCYKKLLIMRLSAAADNKVKRRLAACYEKTSDFALAETLLKESLANFPDYEGYLTLGRLYYSSQNYERASEVFSSAIRLAPSDNYEALIMTGLSYIKSNRLQEAIEILKIARREGSTSTVSSGQKAVSHFLSGIALFKGEKIESALLEFSRAESFGAQSGQKFFISEVAAKFKDYCAAKIRQNAPPSITPKSPLLLKNRTR